MILKTSWSELKRISQSKDIRLDWVDAGGVRYAILVDGALNLHAILEEGSPEWNEFNTDFAPLSGRRNTISTLSLPDPGNFRFRGNATSWTICAPGSSNLDFAMAEELHVDGGTIVAHDANPGDYCMFEIVHPLAGVVERFVEKWFIKPGTGETNVSVYRAKVPAGLTIRVVYHNTGNAAVGCGINLRLHKLGTGQ